MKVLCSVFWICLTLSLCGQDIDRIIRSKPFSHRGSVNLSSTTFLGKQTAQPFTVMLSANYTPEIFGIAIPFSVMYSNLSFSYGLPFRYWKFAPSYRWIRTQFGETNVVFSPYSLAGHRIYGAAVDVQPDDHFTISAVYGRLKEFREADSNQTNGSLKRLGYGVKIAFNNPKYGVSGSFFKAKDQDQPLAVVNPQENIILDFSGYWKLSKQIQLSGQWASSALTQNTQDNTIPLNFKLRDWIGQLLPYRASTAISSAYKFNFGTSFLNIGYERVTPNYQSLGANYMTNDIENITINLSQKIKTVAVSGSLGVQHNNLTNQRTDRNRRFVCAANLGYAAKSGFSGHVGYSSFQTFTRVEKPFSEFENPNPYPDTLTFRQVMQLGDVNIGYSFQKNATAQHALSFSFSIQSISENTRFLASSLNYSWAQKSGNTSGISTFFHQEHSEFNQHRSGGLTVFYSRSFAKRQGKWNVALSETIDQSQTHFLTLKANASYLFQKKHQFQLQFSQRFSSEYSALLNINYSYAFGR